MRVLTNIACFLGTPRQLFVDRLCYHELADVDFVLQECADDVFDKLDCLFNVAFD